MAAMIRGGADQSQEFHPSWGAGREGASRIWEYFCCFPGISTGSWIRSTVTGTWTSIYMGYWHCRQKPNLLYHYASPVIVIGFQKFYINLNPFRAYKFEINVYLLLTKFRWSIHPNVSQKLNFWKEFVKFSHSNM